MEDLTCKHCGTLITGKFCSECGQRYLTTPYSKEIIIFLFTQSLDFGANYFKTLWKLLVRPNEVVSTFLSGDVKTYLNPLKYLVLTVALLIVVDLSESFITGDPDGISELMELQIYGVLFMFSLYLIVANKLFWNQFKWVEHVIISPYLAIQMLLIVIISYLPISLIADWGYIESKIELMAYPFSFMGIYYFYYYISVFHKRKFITFIKSVSILIIAIMLMTITYAIIYRDEL